MAGQHRLAIKQTELMSLPKSISSKVIIHQTATMDQFRLAQPNNTPLLTGEVDGKKLVKPIMNIRYSDLIEVS